MIKYLKPFAFAIAFIMLFGAIGCTAKETTGTDENSSVESSAVTVTSDEASSENNSGETGDDPSSNEPSSSNPTSSDSSSKNETSSNDTTSKDDPDPEPTDPYEGMKKLKIMSYNIRCLRGGGSGNGLINPMTEQQMNDTISKFDALLTREAPDLLIVTEDRAYFDADRFATSGGTKPVYELMFQKHFPYKYHIDSGANWPHIYSKYPIKDVTRLNVAYGSEITSGTNRKPTLVTITVEGVDIQVIGCHPVSGGDPLEIAARKYYFNSIIEYIKDKEYVIIAGDMNTESSDPQGEHKVFKDAGLSLGNHGTFGSFVTYRDNRGFMIDNIITKGFLMKNFWVGTEDYSDHFPIYSEVYLDK